MGARKTNGIDKKRAVRAVYQPTVQPDFGVGFHTRTRAPIRYESRQFCANGKHDFIYLSSYLHDAEFRLDEIRMWKMSLAIPVRRARWELYRELDELLEIPSEVTVWALKSLDIHLGAPFTATKGFLKKPKLIMQSLEYVSGDRENEGRIIISCNLNSKLVLQVGDEYKVRLVDAHKQLR